MAAKWTPRSAGARCSTDGTFGLISFRASPAAIRFDDGNDTTNQFYNENAGRTSHLLPISQDAVQGVSGI